MKRVRPELDLYLLSNGRFEEPAGNPNANALRRVFYAVDELLELHLAILEGEQARYDTPFFNNVNTPPPKGGGFRLRLEAGLIDPLGRFVQTTLKLSSGSSGF